MKLHKGDKVIVIAGNDKGTEGEITRVLRSENKVIIEGVNVKKKHVKGGSDPQTGGIVDMTHPINASNVALLDPKNNKPTRVGYIISKDKKVRVAKKSGTQITK